jgi:hypothetical protein
MGYRLLLESSDIVSFTPISDVVLASTLNKSMLRSDSSNLTFGKMDQI